MEYNYLTCECSDFGCTMRVGIDKDPGWRQVFFEYQLNTHLPFRKRFWDGLRYIFGYTLKNNHGGTTLGDDSVRELKQRLSDYLGEDLEALVDWGYRTVADFEFGYDDFRGRWFAKGVYLCDVGGPEPTGATAVECLKNLKAQYQEWEKQFNRSQG